jgi:hypothetical protein
MRIPFSTRSLFSRRNVVIAGLVVAGAGGAAALALPAIAAHSSAAPTALAPVSTDASGAAAKGVKAFGRGRLVQLLIRATVKETGLDRGTVLERLRAGETLAQIAGGKAQAVESDAMDMLRTRLDRAVDRGRITKDQEAGLLAAARSGADSLMSKSLKGLSDRKHRLGPVATPTPSAAA